MALDPLRHAGIHPIQDEQEGFEIYVNERLKMGFLYSYPSSIYGL
jgi:hypothetical protein